MPSIVVRVREAYRDPRLYQITVLTALLVYGVVGLGWDAQPWFIPLVLGTTLATQAVCTRALGLARFDARSPLISGLSLCLLLRTGSPVLAVAVAFITIASKFVIRSRGKHVFNPTNFGLAVALLAGAEAWISPGQWGSVAWAAFFFACLGGLVVNRAARSDVTWAFLFFYSAIVFGRSFWLSEPPAIPLHRLQNGAFLLFTFFMISDPKTTPDRRAGRVAYAALVAALAAYLQYGRFETNGLIYALVFSAPLVPLLDRVFRGARYVWGDPHLGRPTGRRSAGPGPLLPRSTHMQRWTTFLVLILAWTFTAQPVLAFCGFYVARADADLFNEASQVVLVRHDGKTVITMANDYQGDPTEFALVVPVPTFIERGQINVASMNLIDHLDAYTAPRLVEYFDGDPCLRYMALKSQRMSDAMSAPSEEMEQSANRLGVTVEATYTVGEYDILILSAEESDGLETWLKQNGYRLPRGASRVLGSYIKQDMRFFVAKVNLKEQQRLGYQMLRPLQVAFASPKFMLPIRLGTLNARGPQDLVIYALTRNGRVETTNYRTVKLPSNLDVPVFVKDDFADFYRDMFAHQVQKQGMRTVFTEYAWNMAWCDPCAADPLSRDQLRALGVFWLDGAPGHRKSAGGAQEVYVTRLHVRYDEDHFPDDLVLQETGDTSNFQGRYVLRHPWTGSTDCDVADEYRREVRERRERAAKNLVELTGWDLTDVRDRMHLHGQPEDDRKWWERLWGKKG